MLSLDTWILLSSSPPLLDPIHHQTDPSSLPPILPLSAVTAIVPVQAAVISPPDCRNSLLLFPPLPSIHTAARIAFV
jgi:hypothetical protein